MKILITGGTGVIGAGAIPELLKRGHQLRLLSRGAKGAARDYPRNVEPFAADVSDSASLEGAAAGCDAVIHITGIVEEKPPEITFQKINIGGTASLLSESARAGVRRFIFISSRGADRGESDYHKSKLMAERLVQESALDWIIVRPGNVYGPGDEVISTLLKMIRLLPAIPVIAGGDQRFQPIWFEDLGKAIARACDDVPSRQIYELTGDEVTTPREVIDILSSITDRHPPNVPVPVWLARIGTSMAEMFGGFGQKIASQAGAGTPLNSAKLQMLMEGNVSRTEDKTLREKFGVTPTPLRTGLTALADLLPELLPEDGVGSLHRKRFWADIQNPRYSAEELLIEFSSGISDFMPIEFEAEPGAPKESHLGATMTGAIPGRGNIQVRVEEKSTNTLTLATIEGHPLAGLVTFRTKALPTGVSFLVEVHARAANIFDWLALNTVGASMQNQNWKELVNRVIHFAGGEAPKGVESCSEQLNEKEAGEIESWARRIVRNRKRVENQADSIA